MAVYGDGINTTYAIVPLYDSSERRGPHQFYNWKTGLDEIRSYESVTFFSNEFFGSSIAETVTIAAPVAFANDYNEINIYVESGGGDDTAILKLKVQAGQATNTSAAFVMGDGYDTVRLDFSEMNEVRSSQREEETYYSAQYVDDDTLAEAGIYIDGDETERLVVKGSGGNDRLYGTRGDDWLDGFKGNDQFRGSAGNDAYVFDSLLDALGGESVDGGTDTIWSSVDIDLRLYDSIENARLYAAEGLSLHGNALQNLLTGNTQANTITGGAGYDKLSGKGGADLFSYGEMGAGNRDLIVDFDTDDTILLDRAAFRGLVSNGGRLDAAAFVVGKAATALSAQIIYNAGTGMVSYDADGAGYGAALDIVRIGTGAGFFDSGDILIA